ncbi:MAG: hypothetical protein K2X09_05135, partial [Rickettsiales bacterium]|nr:hypothetical protein [Rickettsiales bacterium]
YCCCTVTTINSMLDDDDDDDDRHHHHLHHKCQHEELTQATHFGVSQQASCHKHCCHHHHEYYWVSIGSCNLFAPRFKSLRIFPEDDDIPAEDLMEQPFRPPAMAIARMIAA